MDKPIEEDTKEASPQRPEDLLRMEARVEKLLTSAAPSKTPRARSDDERPGDAEEVEMHQSIVQEGWAEETDPGPEEAESLTEEAFLCQVVLERMAKELGRGTANSADSSKGTLKVEIPDSTGDVSKEKRVPETERDFRHHVDQKRLAMDYTEDCASSQREDTGGMGPTADVAPFPPVRVIPQPVERPGAYSLAPGVDMQRNQTFSPSQLHQLSNVTSSDLPSTDWNTSIVIGLGDSLINTDPCDLVEAQSVSQGDLEVAGEATEVDPTALERKTRQWQSERRWIRFGLIAVAMGGILCSILVVVFLKQDSSVKSPSDPVYNMTPSEDSPGTPANHVDLGEIPDYTMANLADPFSPQSQAYYWLSQYQKINGTVLPQWRQRQLFALGCMYYSFNGPKWPLGLNKDWMDYSKSECDWYSGLFGVFEMMEGVIYTENQKKEFNCDASGHVHTIQVAMGAKLFNFSVDKSSIPPEISWLPALKFLGMWTNGLSNFASPELFPPQFYQLTNLEHLNLGDNLLNKPIPSELGLLTKLTTLKLHKINATGTIPTDLGRLTNLVILELFRNQLTGTIPTELFSLGRIWLHSNKLSGTIPSELGRLTSTWSLRLDNNFLLSGNIPSEFGLLNQSFFRIDNTNASGTIPAVFCRLGDETCTYLEMGKGDRYAPRPCFLGFNCSSEICGCDCPCN